MTAVYSPPRSRALGFFAVGWWLALGLMGNLLATDRAPFLRPGDRWAFIGDSITHHGTYPAWLLLYQATRFPTATLFAANCGISGDSAAGALQRYDWDIAPNRPTVATIMLGMNDVDRDAYAASSPTPEVLRRRADALERYRQNLDALVRRLQKDGVRVALVTPSPFDETVAVDFPPHRGVNDALAACARFIRELADSTGATVVDLHGPMTALNTQRQLEDSHFTLIGSDRVHPGPAGHLTMAYYFLKGTGAPATVARLEIDAVKGQANAQNATIENLHADAASVTFDTRESALPFPVPEEARAALAWVPFQEDLNQEILRITGLHPGRYALTIDGRVVTECSAEQLQSGLNLAVFESTPQMIQAREVLRLVVEWQTLVAHSLRTLAEVEHWRLRDTPRPLRFADVRPALLQAYDDFQRSDAPNRKWDLLNLERYFVLKPQEVLLSQQAELLQMRIRVAAQPQPHSFRITPLAGASIPR